MKNAIEQLEDLRRIEAAVNILREDRNPFDIHALIEGLDEYIENRLNDMFVAGGLDISDIEVCRAFIETSNKTEAAVKYGCSIPWLNRLLAEICEQVDTMGKGA